MINLYSWDTSNGRKIAILLEELQLPYNFHPINIGKGEQFSPAFLQINPNGKIPAIVDPDGPDGKEISVFESGAIMIYLAEKTNSGLLPKDPRDRTRVMEWLMFQMGGVGPQLGQALHFYKYADEKIQYGIDRYMKEAHRIYSVMDKWLADKTFFAGDYSLADISIYPWIARHEWLDIDWTDYPHLKRWFDRISEREAVKKGLTVLAVKN